jgi:hypothetical protein
MLLSRKAIENYINSLFAKVDLTADLATDRRVKTVLVSLGDRHCLSDELRFRWLHDSHPAGGPRQGSRPYSTVNG